MSTELCIRFLITLSPCYYSLISPIYKNAVNYFSSANSSDLSVISPPEGLGLSSNSYNHGIHDTTCVTHHCFNHKDGHISLACLYRPRAWHDQSYNTDRLISDPQTHDLHCIHSRGWISRVLFWVWDIQQNCWVADWQSVKRCRFIFVLRFLSRLHCFILSGRIRMDPRSFTYFKGQLKSQWSQRKQLNFATYGWVSYVFTYWKIIILWSIRAISMLIRIRYWLKVQIPTKSYLSIQMECLRWINW